MKISTSFTNAELIEVVNYTPKGQKLLAEQKQRLEEQLESAKFVNIPISNTLSSKFPNEICIALRVYHIVIRFTAGFHLTIFKD